MSFSNLFFSNVKKVKPFVKSKIKRQSILRYIHPRIREEHRLAKLTGPSGYWKELREYQLDFLKQTGLQPHHQLLDIGCGPLQGGIAFINYLNKNNYVGVDIREGPLEEAYKQIVKNNLVNKNPRLVISKTFGKKELNGNQFDYVWTCQMLYHLDQDALNCYFECISNCLKPGGLLYGDILGPENEIPENILWNGLRHIKHSLDFMQKAALKYGLKMRHLGNIEEFGYPVPYDLKYNDMLEFKKL
jgi:SAM-dependent methyltransferase